MNLLPDKMLKLYSFKIISNTVYTEFIYPGEVVYSRHQAHARRRESEERWQNIEEELEE